MRSLFLLALALPGFGQTLKLEAIPNPSMRGSLQSHWGIASGGNPLLSCLEPGNGAHGLKYAIRR